MTSIRAGMLLIALCIPAAAQEHQTSHFETASVKPVEGTDGSFYTRSINTRRVSYSAISLRSLIGIAYNVSSDQIVIPNGLESALFSVYAVCPPDTEPEDARTMLSNLLEEQLGVLLHRGKKEVAGYQLVKGPSGVKLQTAKLTRHSAVYALPDFAKIVGVLVSLQSPASMPAHVVDNTGLTGSYDFSRWFGEIGLSGLVAALEPEMGLRIEKAKVKIDILIVDSAERTPLGELQ